MQIVAKECINSQKAIQRLHMQKAHFLDMECALKEQLGMAVLSHWAHQRRLLVQLIAGLWR